jgi:uncharacterized protein (DUF305 family)
MQRIVWAALASVAIGSSALAQAQSQGQVQAQPHNHDLHGTTPKPAVPRSSGVTTATIPVPAPPPAAAPVVPVQGHGSHDHGKAGEAKAAAPAAQAPTSKDTASTAAFRAVNAKMHDGMNVPFTGNADYDFIQGMIPHHEGAVDMAKIVLKHGKDPQVKKLAREIIKAQDKEIAFMKAWLAKNTKTR